GWVKRPSNVIREIAATAPVDPALSDQMRGPHWEPHAGGKMNDVTSRIAIDKQLPGYWRVTLNHPPINTIDDRMYDEVFDLVEAIEAEPSLKVVTFKRANPDRKSV